VKGRSLVNGDRPFNISAQYFCLILLSKFQSFFEKIVHLNFEACIIIKGTSAPVRVHFLLWLSGLSRFDRQLTIDHSNLSLATCWMGGPYGSDDCSWRNFTSAIFGGRHR
jgi:hypothetical protein